MALSANEISILIKARDDASKTMKDVEKNAGGLGKVLGGALKVGALAAVAGVGALAGGLALCVKDAMEAQKVMTQTEAVIASTGGVSGMTAKSVSELATSLSKVIPIDDELIQATENMLLTFTNVGKDVFPAATEAALDMAIALGEDSVGAAQRLGKALQDPISGVTALRKVGVMLTDQQEAQIKAMMEAGDVAGAQRVILRELGTEFGKSGRAAGQTMAGQLKILQTQLGNVKETIGAALIPILTKGATALTSFLTDHMDDIERFATLIGRLAEEGFAALGRAIDALGPFLADVVPKIVDFAEAVGGQVIKDFQETILPGIQTAIAAIKEPLGKVVDFFSDLFKKAGPGGGAANVGAIAKAIEAILILLTAAALVALGSFVVGIAHTVINFGLMPIKAIWETGAAIKNFVTEAGKMVSKAITITQKIVHEGAQIITGLVDTTQKVIQHFTRHGTVPITDFKDKTQTIIQKVKVELPSPEQQGKVAGGQAGKGFIRGLSDHINKVLPEAFGALIGGALVAMKAAELMAYMWGVAGVIASALVVAGMLAWPAAISYALYRAFTDAVPALFKAIADVDWGAVGRKLLYGFGFAVGMLLFGIPILWAELGLLVAQQTLDKFRDFGTWLWDAISPGFAIFGEVVGAVFSKSPTEWATLAAKAVAKAFVEFGQWISDAALPGIKTFFTETSPTAISTAILQTIPRLVIAAAEIGQNILSGIAQGLADLITDPTGTLTTWIFNPLVMGSVQLGKDILRLAAEWGGKIIEGILDGLGGLPQVVAKEITDGLSDAWDFVTGPLKGHSPSPAGIQIGNDLIEGIAYGLKGLGSTLIDQFRAAWNAAVSWMDDNFKISIPGPSAFGVSLPDFNWNPDLSFLRLAQGGIVTRPTLALIAERGPEAVIPLRGMAAAGVGGTTIINNYIKVGEGAIFLGDRRERQLIVDAILPEIKRRVG